YKVDKQPSSGDPADLASDLRTKPAANVLNPDTSGKTYYGMSNGVFGYVAPLCNITKTCAVKDITDGSSKTFMIGERDGSDNTQKLLAWNGGYRAGIWIGTGAGTDPIAHLGNAGLYDENRLQAPPSSSTSPAIDGSTVRGYASVHRGVVNFVM